MRLTHALALPVALLVSGCHSAYVNSTIQNHTTQTITLVELDYPSASFGTQTLNPGQEFKYRFKVLGSGTLKLLWTDPQRQEQQSDGPHLDEGAEGNLTVAVTPAGVVWSPIVGKASHKAQE